MQVSRQLYKARMLALVAVTAAVIGGLAALLLKADDPGIGYMEAAGPVFESLEELATEAGLVVVGRVSLPR